jgi:homopolymeric O-antigen transport system ATP-binding protein
MGDFAIRVQNLGKQYDLRARRQPEPMLREVVTSLVTRPVTRLATRARRLFTRDPGLSPAAEESPSHFWALRGLSFEIEPAQIVGIIGPNGAGKSTLLKILSRITEPTEGRVEIHGRIGSLLEVGTGFHPELTGRENVYLSGALLGMPTLEIDRKLDEILAFAEISRFADTAVKYYSTGMYVRLAFAVAAHFEPEVLLVDEVLAVGDVAFQRKCLAKMEEVKEHGRTILLVSHNMAAITRLCERAILISDGTVQRDGPATEIASEYMLRNLKTSAEQAWPEVDTAPGDNVVRLRGVRVHDEDGTTTEVVDIRRPVALEMIYDVQEPGHVLLPRYDFFNEAGTCLFAAQESDSEWRRHPRPIGRFTSTAWIPGNLLAEGVVLVAAAIVSPEGHRQHVHQGDAVGFQVTDSIHARSGTDVIQAALPGLVRPRLRWSTTAPSASQVG